MPNDDVSIALIQACQAVAVAALGGLGVVGYRRIRRASERTRHEITNDHELPLREDMDGKHAQQMTVQRLILSQLTETRKDIGGIREEIRELRAEDVRTNQRIDDTIDTRRRQNHD